jgi:hypothetical protein
MARYKPLLTAVGAFSARASVGVHSEAIFRSIEEQATQEAWYTSLRLPRTWITEHSLIALHVWILHNRAKLDYNVSPVEFCGRRMQEEMFERLWEDTILRIRNAGVAEVSVNKQLENVQKITFDDMFGYDAALRTSDRDDGLELSAAVWRGVFREDEAADTEAVLRLADYVRREVEGVVLAPREDVYRGWLTWGPVVGETPESRAARQRAMLEGEWREALHPDGRLYFYHTSTHETRWEPPMDGFYPRRRFAIQRYIQNFPEKAACFPTLAVPQAALQIGGASVAANDAPSSSVAANFKELSKASKVAREEPKGFLARFFG